LFTHTLLRPTSNVLLTNPTLFIHTLLRSTSNVLFDTNAPYRSINKLQQSNRRKSLL